MNVSPQIGWVGLGSMGSRMAPNLLKKGYSVTGFDIAPSRLSAAAARGIAEAPTLSELVSKSDAIFSMVPDDDAFLDIVRAARDNAKLGSCLIDMSTVSPDASEQAAELLTDAGIAYLRAPVSGSTTLAEAGTLSVLVSGPKQIFDKWRILIEILGSKIAYLRSGEQARIMKLVVNSIVASINTSLAEALNLGRRSGLDWSAMIDVIGESAVKSPYITSKLTKLKERDWSPAASVAVIAKDMDLALDLARKRGAFMPVASIARQILAAVDGRGQRDLDMSCVATFFE